MRALGIRLGSLAGGVVRDLGPSRWGVHGARRGERVDLFPRPESPGDAAVVVKLKCGLGPVEVVLSPLSHVDGQPQLATDIDVALNARAIGRRPVLVELEDRIRVPYLREDV